MEAGAWERLEEHKIVAGMNQIMEGLLVAC